MTNLEIDRKLAEAMGFTVLKGQKIMNQIQIIDDSGEERSFAPMISIEDAWEVAEWIGIDDIRRLINGEWQVWKRGSTLLNGKFAQDQSVTKAICLLAIRKIEGSKSDE